MRTRSTDAPAPRVLVAFASRHGGTREIAAAIARALTGGPAARHRRVSVVLSPMERRPDPAQFDAVVLGSPVYEGRWLEPAQQYALEVAARLPRDSAWLFSSGLAPASHRPPTDHTGGLGDLLGARGEQWFAGRVEPRLLSAVERAAWDATAVAGDFRDWRAVRTWSEQIAADVLRPASLAPAG